MTDRARQSGTVRIAAVADLHSGRQGPGGLPALLERIDHEADVLVACGDLTDHGLPDEARGLCRELRLHTRIPMVAVLGNHDVEAQQVGEVVAILRDAGVMLLDGDACEVHGVAFVGTKGFCGGFDPHALGAWGEPTIKRFVHEVVHEALKLETALARTRGGPPVVLLHYSPSVSTVAGEPEVIYPFLGCSRLAEPLERRPIAAVFHGHAHWGTATGSLASGTPVLNVSLPLLLRIRPEQPFHLLDYHVPEVGVPAAGRAT
jgi:Icc-related predicted phosphoesterase